MLLWTSKLTGHFQSGDDRLTKCVRLFWYFYWLLRKSLFKLDRRKFLDCCYSMGCHKKNILIFTKASHTLILAKFHFNLINLHTLLIHWIEIIQAKINLEFSALKEIHTFATSLKWLSTWPCHQSMKNHSPAARGLRILLVFYQHPVWQIVSVVFYPAHLKWDQISWLSPPSETTSVSDISIFICGILLPLRI